MSLSFSIWKCGIVGVCEGNANGCVCVGDGRCRFVTPRIRRGEVCRLMISPPWRTWMLNRIFEDGSFWAVRKLIAFFNVDW